MSEERKAAERLVLRLLGLAAAFAVIRWVLPEVWDKLSPFIIAVPIAAALQPVIRFLQKRIKMKPSPASLIPVNVPNDASPDNLMYSSIIHAIIWPFVLTSGAGTSFFSPKIG